jgi:hypothetical protein
MGQVLLGGWLFGSVAAALIKVSRSSISAVLPDFNVCDRGYVGSGIAGSVWADSCSVKEAAMTDNVISDRAPTGRRAWMTPRTRGAITGLGLLLLGAWGAVIPFVGPYFDYAYTPNTTWTWTAARFFLEVLPGAVAFFAGLVLLASANRVIASLAAWLAVAAGAWLVIGPLLAPLWRADYIGTPVGNTTAVSVEQIGMFYGLGAAIALLAGVALGRFSVVGIRDVAYADRRTDASAAPAVPAVEDPAKSAPSNVSTRGSSPTIAPTDDSTLAGQTESGGTHRRHRFHLLLR